MIIFTSTKKRKLLIYLYCLSNLIKDNYVRFIKNPDGPTLTFKIISYSDKK